jgi:GntR family transcriptional regulator
VDGAPVEYRITLIRGDQWAVVADWSSRGYSVGAAARVR